jgi:hypothetical protein
VLYLPTSVVSISQTELAALDGVTGSLDYSTENYGATGTGDIVLSTGATITSPVITTPQIAASDTTVAAVVGLIVFKTSNGHFYGCVATTGAKWKILDN